MFSAVLIDVALVAILAFFIWLGAKKGFVLTLCSLVAVIVALVGANLVADIAAPMVANAIQPTLERTIQEALEEKALEVGTQVSDMDVIAVLRGMGGAYEWAADTVDKALNSMNLLPTAAGIAAAAAATVAQQLAHGLIFFVAFFIVLLLWGILSHALDLITKLPVIHGLNRTLGGALGLVKGLVILYVIVWALYDLTGTISTQTAAETHLFMFLLTHGPLELLSSL